MRRSRRGWEERRERAERVREYFACLSSVHSRSASDAQGEMASPRFHKECFSPSPVLAGEKRFLAPCGYHFEISGNVSLYVCDHHDYASLGGYPVFLAAVLTEILKF